VARPLGLEHPFDRQQREAVLRYGSAKLLQRGAICSQLLEKLTARLASLPARSLEQSLRLEVDRHHNWIALRPKSASLSCDFALTDDSLRLADSPSPKAGIPTIDRWLPMGSSFRS